MDSPEVKIAKLESEVKHLRDEVDQLERLQADIRSMQDSWNRATWYGKGFIGAGLVMASVVAYVAEVFGSFKTWISS